MSFKYNHTIGKRIFNVIGILVSSLINTQLSAQIISQYVETESGTSPKGIEIWNNTEDSLDFTQFPLRIYKGTNGAPLRLDFELAQGGLAPSQVLVIGTSDIQPSVEWNQANFYLEYFTFNGDDALAVSYGDSITDRFGLEGSDPGQNWSDAGVSTSNSNIALKFGLLSGDLMGWSDPSHRFQTLSTHPSQDIEQSLLEGFGVPPATTKLLSEQAGWHLISLPNHSSKLSDISDDILIQGIPGGEYPSSTPNAYLFDEIGEWSVPVHIDSIIPNGVGLALYHFGNSSNLASDTHDLLGVSGVENTENVQVPLHRGGPSRFTLVGNPYPTFYDIQVLSVNEGSIQNTIVTWNPSLNVYELQNLNDGYWLAPWEAFWVETSDALVDSLQFLTIGRRGNLYPFQQKKAERNQMVVLSFTLKSEIVIDKALAVVFSQEAEIGWDAYDATKLMPMNTDKGFMAFRNNGRIQSVVSVPNELLTKITLPIEIHSYGDMKELQLSWEGIEAIENNLELLLFDRVDSSYVSLYDQEFISFTLDTSSSKTKQRFHLLIRPIERDQITSRKEYANDLGYILDQNYPNPFNPRTTIAYTIPASTMVKLEVYNTRGQRVAVLENSYQQAGKYDSSWNAKDFSTGVYFLQLRTDYGVKTRKMLLIR